MKNIIYIDTSNNKDIVVALRIDEKEYRLSQAVDARRAQIVLPLLEKLLGEHNLSLKDITGIEVNKGPGSFTGLRVGVTIANTLSYLLHVPVNGGEVGKFVEPTY